MIAPISCAERIPPMRRSMRLFHRECRNLDLRCGSIKDAGICGDGFRRNECGPGAVETVKLARDRIEAVAHARAVTRGKARQLRLGCLGETPGVLIFMELD